MVFLITYVKDALTAPQHDLRYSLMTSIIPAISDLLIFSSTLGFFTRLWVFSDLTWGTIFPHSLPLSPNLRCGSTSGSDLSLFTSGSYSTIFLPYVASGWSSCSGSCSGSFASFCCDLAVRYPFNGLNILALSRQQCQLLMWAAIITAMSTPLGESFSANWQ